MKRQAVEVRQFQDGRYGFWYRVGKTKRRWVRLKTKADAQERAKEVSALFGNGRADLLNISPAEVAEFRRWKEQNAKGRTVPRAVAEFMALKTADTGLNPKYRDNLADTLNRFAAAFPKSLITEVTPAQIEKHLSSLRKKARTRNNIRDQIVSLFRFASRAGAGSVGRVKIRNVDTSNIWTPEEMARLLAECRAEYLPWLALAAFAGIRTEETRPEPRSPKSALRWEDFHWPEKFIAVRGATAKTGKPRHVPMSENLIAWLEPWHEATGDVMTENPRNESRRLATALDMPWRKNASRHSFGSYRMAIIHSFPQLAEEMGNSVAVVQREYHAPQSETLARQWFALMPSRAANIVSMGGK